MWGIGPSAPYAPAAKTLPIAPLAVALPFGGRLK